MEQTLRPLDVSEQDRLAALHRYGILDTEAEKVYDDLVAAAAALAGTPTALVSLVDAERQWFKARVGMEVCETARDISFCDRVVRDDAELIVTDAAVDPRFSSNPLVTGPPGIRFYAGFPLRSPEGLILGTLCVIDYRPQRLEPAQVVALRALAGQVMSQLELRTALAREQQARTELRASEEKMRAALDALPRQVTLLDVVRDADGEPCELRLAWANAQVREATSMGLDRIAGRKLEDVFPSIGREIVAEYLAVARDGIPFTRLIDWFDGEHLHDAVEVTAVPWAAGGLLVDVEDVSGRRRAELALAASQRRLEMAQDMAGIATWSWDLVEGVVAWSPGLRAMFGAPDDVRPSFDFMVSVVHPAERPDFVAVYGRLLCDGEPVTMDHRIVSGDGTERWVRAWAVAERDFKGRVVRIEGSKQEITEHRVREATLLRAATRDHLTGLVNRRGWDESAADVLDGCRRRGLPVCVAVFDIDHFKRVNDSLGHDAGDRLLAECARAWQACVRDSDVLARVGGEEFAVLLPGCEPAAAELLVERLRFATPPPTTISAGLTRVGAGEDLVSAVARADGALYAAKTGGRDRVIAA